jgi:glycosyltransferase involved in cell wall biosynthesis
VPEPDRDAGSACTWHYLQSLVGIGCQVIFLGENFARSEPYTSALEAIGIEVWVGAWHAHRWREILAERAGAIEVVLFNRPHITEVFLPDVRRILPRARLVYFGHDLHFLRERRAAELASGAERERLMRRSQDWARREAGICRAVDAAITISADEVAMIRADFAVDDVSVFPGYVYPGVDAPMVPPAGTPTALFVGGFGHPPNHDAVTWFLAEIWPRVRAVAADARLWIVGSDMPVSLRHPAPGVAGLGWLSEDDLQARYRAAHVVVAPLRFGAGLKGKVVQAMALGLPVVTTAIGCEGLPDSAKDLLGRYDAPSDFAARVVELFRDSARNLTFRAQVLADAKRHFSRAASQDFFRDLVGRLRPQSGWCDGLAHDGWMGRRARLRAAVPGRYRIAVWCPQFHFIGERGPVALTAHVDGKTIAHLVFSDSRNAELMFDVPGGARREVVEFRISRTTVPKVVGVGEDVRELGLMLVACEPACDQPAGAALAGLSGDLPA